MQEVRLIDANALYREVKTECNPYGKPTIGFDDGKKVLEMINRQPTIEAEPVKHGTWIDTPVPAENTFVAKCSVCGFWQKTNCEDKTGKHLIHKAVYRYCAGCGARMDAEDINVLTSDGGAENG